MGKATSVLAVAAIIAASVLLPLRHDAARAQTTPVACSGAPEAAPMQGHYTGAWHSDADYHFYVLQMDVNLKVFIDGTIDATVSPTGQLSGVVQGKVNAPLYHDGIHDIGSGHGTISGTLTGIYGTSGAQVVLTNPTIFMHWGTFVGDGSTQDRYIAMPTYTFNVGIFDCISTGGTVAETNFPQQTILADEAGQLAYAIGVGQATGTWNLVSDTRDKFAQLSSQVDSFINSANTWLHDPSTVPTPSAVQSHIAAPLKALEETIRADPTVARCLLDRLGAWEASAASPMLHDALSRANATDLPTLRLGSDSLRSAHLLDIDCSLPETDAVNALTAGDKNLLDGRIAAHDWSGAALFTRELLLLAGDPGRGDVQSEVVGDLHTLATTLPVSPALLDVARIAYAISDTEDSAAAIKRLALHVSADVPHTQAWVSPELKKKKGKGKTRRKPTPTPKPTPKTKTKPKPTPTHTPTPVPTPTPTATPKPRTIDQIVLDGIAHMQTTSNGSATPTLSWQAVAGATRYVVLVMSSGPQQIAWSWSGTTTSVTYGDTTLPAPSGSEDWPIPLVAGATWSVLALDASGKIVGADFSKSAS